MEMYLAISYPCQEVLRQNIKKYLEYYVSSPDLYSVSCGYFSFFPTKI